MANNTLRAIRADVDRLTHGNKPQESRTSGTGIALATSVSRGVRYFERQCENCDTFIRIPEDATAKVFEPKYENGKEIKVLWYASTRQTRINGAADYVTPRPMSLVQAQFYFEDKLFGKVIQGRPAAGNMAQQATIYRKESLRDDLTLCRKCFRLAKRDKVAQHINTAIIVRPKQGKERKILPNLGKPLPLELQGYGMHKETAPKAPKGEVRTWYCSTPSTRREASFTVKTDKPMTLEEAREFFRRATGRATLAGCSITG